MKKFMAGRPFADPDAAARKIVEIANDVEAVQDGRIYFERAVSSGSRQWRRLAQLAAADKRCR